MAGDQILDEESLKDLVNVDPKVFENLNSEEQELLRSMKEFQASGISNSSVKIEQLVTPGQPTYGGHPGGAGSVPPSAQTVGQGRVLGNLRVLTRQGWAAFPPKSMAPLKLPVDYVRLTWQNLSKYGGTLEESLRKCQLNHTAQGLPDIAYNFLVDGSLVIEGRGWETQPDMPEKFGTHLKSNCLNIAYIGDENDYPEKEPPLELFSMAMHLIDIGVNEKYVNPNYEPIPHD